MRLLYRLSRLYFGLRARLAVVLSSPFLRTALVIVGVVVAWRILSDQAPSPPAQAVAAALAEASEPAIAAPAPVTTPRAAVETLLAAGADLSGADLRALAGRDLSGLTAPDGARLARARLAGLTLTGADLSSADLTAADLAEIDFAEAVLAGADLRGADLTDARLAGATLDGARIERARFTSADLSDASIAGAVGAAIWDGAWAWSDRPPRAAPPGLTVRLCAPPSDGPRPRARPPEC